MRLRTVGVILTATALAATAPDLAAQEGRTYVVPRSADDTEALPFSGGVMVGNVLYLSGTLGLDEEGEVPATAEAEARNALNNVRRVLEEAGMTMDDLVRVQVFCSDVRLYNTFNAVYRTYFDGEFPARAFIGSGTLLRGARFEVQGIAVRRGDGGS